VREHLDAALLKTTDAEGNFVEQNYDKNSNVVQVKRTEKAQVRRAARLSSPTKSSSPNPPST
jgi:YD repeat-containing protein